MFKLMVKAKDTSNLFKSYGLLHKANPHKVDILFNLYKVYTSEYKLHVKNYWSLFTNNKINNNKFSHLGSTKSIKTNLNSSYLQICLAQSCAILNNHLANIKTKFNEIVNSSSIKDKDILHQLRTINLKHSWLGNNLVYYPIISRFITDDYGNLLEIKEKNETIINKQIIRLARIIYNQITEKQRVRFPDLNKPRLLIDDRLYSLEKTKSIHNNKITKELKNDNKITNTKRSNKSGKPTFDYWLRISTLEYGKRILIPIKSNQYFEQAGGIVGNTIELDFKQFDYKTTQHKPNSLIKPKKIKTNKQLNNLNVGKLNQDNKKINNKSLNKRKINNKKGLTKYNRQLNFVFNKKIQLDEFFKINQFLLNS